MSDTERVERLREQLGEIGDILAEPLFLQSSWREAGIPVQELAKWLVNNVTKIQQDLARRDAELWKARTTIDRLNWEMDKKEESQ